MCKLITIMLVEIKVIMMNTLNIKRRSIEKSINDIALRAITRLEKCKDKTCQCQVEWNSDQGYEVVSR